MRRAIAAILLLLLGSSAALAETIEGWWLDDTERGAVVIAPCGDSICGTIGWMKDPRDALTGALKNDIHNPSPALRDQTVCGLRIMWGFKPDGPDEWTDGRVYDPESGNVYHANASIGKDGTLRLRGYIALPLFGRTKMFTRLAHPPEKCDGPRA